MDVLLIDPPYRSLKGMPTDAAYNLGLTSLAAYLRDNGVSAAVVTGDLLTDLSCGNKYLAMNVKKYAAGQHDYQTIVDDKDHPIWKRIADTVRQTKPAAVGIAYLSPSRYAVERIARAVREADPATKIILGSFHPSFCPDEVMANPDVDFVLRGEGEIPLLALVREIGKASPDWESVPGINYRDAGGQVRSTPAPGLIADLDGLPFPARDLVINGDYDRYRAHSMSSTRGCPYVCTFCADRRLWGGRVRRRSVENVIAEMKHLDSHYKVNNIEFFDGTFTYDRKYLQAFCNAVIDQKLDIEWRCTARYDNLDEEILRLMKKSNCGGMYLGFESGSDRVLKSIDKKTTVAQNIRVSRMIYQSGIPSATAIMLGLPGESKEDVEETLETMKSIKTDLFDINSYIPLPGTPLYDAMSEEEQKNIDWRKVGLKSFDNYFSREMTHDELKAYLTRAYETANKVRNRALVRLGVKLFFKSVVKKLKRLRK
ncbi:MAG: radical SAM protein [Chloroflexota bacterium]